MCYFLSKYGESEVFIYLYEENASEDV